MTQEAQLKACPCCNRKASLERRRGMQTATSGKWYRERVYCRNKKCGLTTATFNRPGQAISAWNTRTPDSVIAELVAFAKDARDEFYHSAHSSGDPSNPDNMQSDVFFYRQAITILAKLEASK